MEKDNCYPEVTNIMQNRPAIVAVGRTKFGEHYGKEPEKLIEEAWLAASRESEIERGTLDACYMSDCFLPITNKLGLEEGFLSELTELHVPMEVSRSVSAALLTASHAVLAGAYEMVLVGGIEKMTDRWDKIRDDLMLLEDPWSYYAGGTPEANHELMLRAYAKKYGIVNENLDRLNLALAEVAVKNHAYAVKNENAQFQRRITVEQVLSAREQARKPLGLYDFAPVSDGATALVLTNETLARKITDKPVYVLGCASATDYLSYPARADITHFKATEMAMQNAIKNTGIRKSEIEVAEVYDQSTIMELVTMEDMGFCDKGTAWKSLRGECEEYSGYYESSGRKIFVNTNGGLKADGNPLGATGGAQIFEIFRQIRGEAGERQIAPRGKAPKYGCVHEFEGFGTKGYVSIFGGA